MNQGLPFVVTPTVGEFSAALPDRPEHTEDGEEAPMLALVVAALVPTVVMSAALALERLERCLLRHVPLDRVRADRRGNGVGG